MSILFLLMTCPGSFSLPPKQSTVGSLRDAQPLGVPSGAQGQKRALRTAETFLGRLRNLRRGLKEHRLRERTTSGVTLEHARALDRELWGEVLRVPGQEHRPGTPCTASTPPKLATRSSIQNALTTLDSIQNALDTLNSIQNALNP